MELYKETEAIQFIDGKYKVIKEKLINDIFLEVRLNNSFVENILTVEENIENLAIGNYFQCMEITPKEILENIVVENNRANLNHNDKRNGNVCLYKRNCGCMSSNTESEIKPLHSDNLSIDKGIVLKIFTDFNDASSVFKETAGVHGAGLYNNKGEKEFFALDIARHNCINKATGFQIKRVLNDSSTFGIIMLSSRINSELIKMCYKAGIKVILSRGAPSYRGVLESQRYNITLISFVRENRFTILNDVGRIN